VNYTGTEPPPDPNKRILPGDLTIRWVEFLFFLIYMLKSDHRYFSFGRYDAEGRIDAIVPLELDELDCDPKDLSAEELNVKLWQYATDGRCEYGLYLNLI